METKEESLGKPRKFVKAIPFILVNVFVERFCSGGILAILVIFFSQKLNFSSDLSTAVFHVNEFVLYFFTIIGAVVADSWLGLFKTISGLNFLFSIGAALIAIASIDSLQLPIKVLSLVGLFTVFVSSGGIKTNQNVFGGNQFKLPEQENQLNTFFSVQYFVFKCGILAGQLIVPILRNDVKCFGMENCFPLAFGVPAVAMMTAMFFLLVGKSFYVHVPPTDNMFVKVCGCIMAAFKTKFEKQKSISKDHWLDYAEEKCGEKLVTETKMVLNVLKIFLTLPLFFAMYSQNSSRFVLQAARMDGDLGFYTIKPDQMVLSMTIFILIMVPIFDYVVYPVLSKFGIKTPLHKIACGFITATASFTIAAIIEWKLKEHSLSILWMLPQYFFIAISDVFVWVSTVNFAYTQAPERMKSVMSSFVYLANAGGSIIVIVVSSTNFMGSQMNEFLMFCGAMVVNIGIFVFLSRNYKGVKKN